MPAATVIPSTRLPYDTTTFVNSDRYAVAVLLRSTENPRSHLMNTYYVPALVDGGIPPDQIIGFGCYFPVETPNKVSASQAKEWAQGFMSQCDDLGIQFLYIADATYFKVFTKQTKAEPHLGYVLPCKIEANGKSYDHINVVLGVHHRSIIYNGANQPKLDMSLDTLVRGYQGNAARFGQSILNKAAYLDTIEEVQQCLDYVRDNIDMVTCDVETFSLDYDKAGIGTIAFAINETDGFAFKVDLDSDMPGAMNPGTLRFMLRQFFENYGGRVVYHGASFDIKVLVYNLFMAGLNDIEGMLDGVQHMTVNYGCTKQMAYLALNTTATLKLGLKALAHEYVGNYALDDDAITDIRSINSGDVLEYNLIDCCATLLLVQQVHARAS